MMYNVPMGVIKKYSYAHSQHEQQIVIMARQCWPTMVMI